MVLPTYVSIALARHGWNMGVLKGPTSGKYGSSHTYPQREKP